MRFKPCSIVYPVLLLLLSCSGGRHHFTVLGEFKNMPRQKVVLRELGIDDKIQVVDSGSTDEGGKFELSGEAAQPGLYQLLFQGNHYILLSVDKGNVKVSGDWSQFENYTVQGSPPSASLRNFIRVVSEHMRDISTYENIVLDSLHAQGKDSMLLMAEGDLKGIKQQLTGYIEQYADTTAFLPNALFAVRILNPLVEQPFMQSFLTGLNRRFPDASQARDFTERYNKMIAMQQQSKQQQFTGGPVMGAMAPEINLSAPDGKQVTLSSLRGKYVLVDFWASWCGPCRAENPNVVATYNRYKDKNFTVLGVSLDDDKEKWMEAIQKDHLTWTHISDLKKWESVAARDYGVESIPTNFLVDKTGKIIARDLRGPALEEKLAEVVK